MSTSPVTDQMRIREMLRDRAGVEPACALLARHLGAANAAEFGGSVEAAPAQDADEQDAAFWRRFESQTAVAAQQLPNAVAQALDVHARNAPMDVNEFMKAASIVPQWARHFEGKATAASPSGCGRGESASVSPTTVDAPWHRVTSSADGNCSGASCSGGPDGKAADAKKRKGSSPATGKRRRRTASKKSAAFRSPPPKSSSSRATFLSPGQEAARSLLALRHGML